jgi:hypothetical protein
MIVYIATRNSDSTEGRGHDLDIGFFSNLETAVECVKGLGVQGVGDGSVYEATIIEDSPEEFLAKKLDRWKLHDNKRLIYGYRKDLLGRWRYGYVDNRDQNDPDVLEFLRLAEKLDVKVK